MPEKAASQNNEMMNSTMIIGGQECPGHPAQWEMPSLEERRVWGKGV